MLLKVALVVALLLLLLWLFFLRGLLILNEDLDELQQISC